MRADICVGLGGLCAERMVLGEVSIGAHTDLQQVNRVARAMVESYGMGASTGVLVRLEEEQRHDHGRSEGLRARVDAEVAGILEKELARANELLAKNRGLIEALVELLLVRKVLDRAELRALTDGGGAHG